jgi:hypothetical protein
MRFVSVFWLIIQSLITGMNIENKCLITCGYFYVEVIFVFVSIIVFIIVSLLVAEGLTLLAEA